MTERELELRSKLIEVARRSNADSLTWGTAGNFSVRIPNSSHILITPSSISYETITPEEMVTIDTDGQIVDGRHKPSFEKPIHCAVYRARPEVNAVIHTEPPYVNSFGVARREIPLVTHNLAKVGGNVPVGPCMTSGSEDFAQKVLDVMGVRNAVIWANHGLMTVGQSLEEALKLAWRIENAAKVYILSLQLGKPHLFSE